MVIGLMFMVLLLADSVAVGRNECTETLTEPGNISNKEVGVSRRQSGAEPARTTASLPASPPTSQPHVFYCEYFIRAPSNSYVEFNLTMPRRRDGVVTSQPQQPRNVAVPVHGTTVTTTTASALAAEMSPFDDLHQQLSSSLSSSSSSSPSPLSSSSSSWNSSVKKFLGSQNPAVLGYCPTKLMVVEVKSGGREKTLRRFCIEENVELSAPQVFHSRSPLIKLNYSWESGQGSSFELSFVFHKWPSPCEHRCDDGSCLPDGALVCNYVSDCLDQSDESNCPPRDEKIESNDFMEVVVIVVVVIFTLGVVSCVFFHYRLTSRLYRQRESSSSAEHHHLNPHTPQSTEVVHLPSTAMDRLEREVALERERRQRRQAIDTDMQLNLPPRISISEDGEEGYEQSQRQLQAAGQQHRLVGSIRPPPNRTVFSGCESPPPYRSNSVSKLEGVNCHHAAATKRGSRASGLHHQSFPPACAVGSKHSSSSSSQHQQQHSCGGNSSPYIPRCHSISSGDKRPQYHSHQQSSASRAHHCAPPSCGHVGRYHHGDATGGASTAPVSSDCHVSVGSGGAGAPAHPVFGGGGGPSHGQFCSHQSAAASSATSPRAPLSVQVPPYCAGSNSHATVTPTSPPAAPASSSSSSHIRDFDPPPDYSQAMR